MEIPKKFCNVKDKKHPVKVKTVGQLIKTLEELPKGLPIMQGDEWGALVIVYNVKYDSKHLVIESVE